MTCATAHLQALCTYRLTFSEELADALSEHAQKNPGEADLCLALSTAAYRACGLDRKTALSMCRRDLVHSAAELMKHEDLTVCV